MREVTESEVRVVRSGAWIGGAEVGLLGRGEWEFE